MPTNQSKATKAKGATVSVNPAKLAKKAARRKHVPVTLVQDLIQTIKEREVASAQDACSQFGYGWQDTPTMRKIATGNICQSKVSYLDMPIKHNFSYDSVDDPDWPLESLLDVFSSSTLAALAL